MEEKLNGIKENIAILNVAIFILISLAFRIHNMPMMYIGYAGVLISFASSGWLLLKAIRFEGKKKKIIISRSIQYILINSVWCFIYFYAQANQLLF